MINIESGLKEVLNRDKKLMQSHVNRISQIDDPCLRRLFYMRDAWDKATMIDDGLQGVFNTGTTLEPVIERIASEVGLASSPRWRIVGQQTPTKDDLLKKYQISGTIDGLVQTEQTSSEAGKVTRKWVTQGVVDIKTSSPNIYPRINSYDDLTRYPWTKKYRGQLQLYALAHNLTKCFILFVNKTNLYDMKFVEFEIDMEYCELLLQKAYAVNKAIESETAPPGANDATICKECRWLSHCCPPLTIGSEVKISTDVELEGRLERLQELELSAKEYNATKKIVDKQLTKGQDIACGKFLILWKQGERNYKAQPAKEAYKIETWTKEIIRQP